MYWYLLVTAKGAFLTVNTVYLISNSAYLDDSHVSRPSFEISFCRNIYRLDQWKILHHEP